VTLAQRMGTTVKRSRSTVAAAVLAIGFLLFAAQSASAVTVQYKNVATSFCLDSNTSRDVYTQTCNGGSFQKWIDSTAGSARLLKNGGTSYCLDSNSAGSVYTNVCNAGNSNQQWTRGSTGTWRNVATGRCLDSNTNRLVYTSTCNGGSFQRWL